MTCLCLGDLGVGSFPLSSESDLLIYLVEGAEAVAWFALELVLLGVLIFSFALTVDFWSVFCICFS